MDPTIILCAAIQNEGGDAVQLCAVLPEILLRLRCKLLRGLLQEHPLLNWGKDARHMICHGSVLVFYVRLNMHSKSNVNTVAIGSMQWDQASDI